MFKISRFERPKLKKKVHARILVSAIGTAECYDQTEHRLAYWCGFRRTEYFQVIPALGHEVAVIMRSGEINGGYN